MIGWKAGFDGGDPQEFEVEYHIIDSSDYSNINFNNEDSANIFIFNHSNATLMTFYDVYQFFNNKKNILFFILVR